MHSAAHSAAIAHINDKSSGTKIISSKHAHTVIFAPDASQSSEFQCDASSRYVGVVLVFRIACA